MKTITIKGRDKDIYSILQENRIRVSRHGLEITGDTDFEKPSVTLAKAAAKNELAELKEEAMNLKIKGFGFMKADKLKGKIAEAKAAEVKQKEDKKATSRKTKEEKKQPKTK